jgi:hypothetical protein
MAPLSSNKKGINMNDWRLRGQERYLKGVFLFWATYSPYREGWDHDHCSFCWRKFAIDGGDFTEGYMTKDRYHWICKECFLDFKYKFGWAVGADTERQT